MKKTINKEDIIKKALKLFAENGYHKTSTNEIAKIANVSKGLIFKYFTNKSKLFSEVIDYSIEKFKSKVSKFEIFSEDPQGIILEAIYFLKNFYDENQDIYQFYLKSIYFEKIPERKNFKEVVKIFSTEITLKIILKLKEKNYLKIESDNDESIMLNFLNSTISRVIESKFFDVKSIFDDKSFCNKFVKLILYGIIGWSINFV